jgi:hypothetical protein
MSKHDASGQMLGYLYQLRVALYLLLSDENERASISIEKFDDIAFANDGDSPDIMIQVKHHINVSVKYTPTNKHCKSV